MNATNTNKIPECYRDFYVEPGTKKLIVWAHHFENNGSGAGKRSKSVGKINMLKDRIES